MSICPMCKNNYTIFREMAAVVVAAESLIDVAEDDTRNDLEVAFAGDVLARVVKTYQETVKRFEPKGEADDVQ